MLLPNQIWPCRPGRCFFFKEEYMARSNAFIIRSFFAFFLFLTMVLGLAMPMQTA